ncbi:MAG: hypothetical protein K2W82_13460 [Candidatus Obscuribacterales bacterium]|nr:hypothetical protein [Candidatus Obscuribacterales bacterium]
MQEITFIPTEVLDSRRHNREKFSCGVEQLDVFLQQKARKETPNLSLTFVLTYKEEPGDIAGYYTLSATKLAADDLPELLKKKIGKYGAVPATLLGRLATAQKFQRNKKLRVGEILLIDAMLRTHAAAQNVASFGLIIDVLKSENIDPTGFYLKYGFIKCTQTDNRMYLPIGTIEEILKKSGLITD